MNNSITEYYMNWQGLSRGFFVFASPDPGGDWEMNYFADNESSAEGMNRFLHE
jgi:hypothetical protein